MQTEQYCTNLEVIDGVTLLLSICPSKISDQMFL
jgi:hypothetical protein